MSYMAGNEMEYAFLASHGKMKSLGALPGGYSFATGINNQGDVVGTTTTKDGLITSVFLYIHGKMRIIGLATDFPWNFSINNRRQIIGLSTSAGDAELWSRGRLTDLGSLRGLGSVALGNNDRGTVVGYSDITPEVASPPPVPTPGHPVPPIEVLTATQHPFVYRNGHMTDLATLGGTSASATAINDRGTIVGWSDTTGDQERAFMYRKGKMTDLGSLGGIRSEATAVNNHGEVVGWSFVAGNYEIDPFLYSDGKMVDLNTLVPANSGITLSDAVAINNKGQIAATGIINGQDVALLMTPVKKGG